MSGAVGPRCIECYASGAVSATRAVSCVSSCGRTSGVHVRMEDDERCHDVVGVDDAQRGAEDGIGAVKRDGAGDVMVADSPPEVSSRGITPPRGSFREDAVTSERSACAAFEGDDVAQQGVQMARKHVEGDVFQAKTMAALADLFPFLNVHVVGRHDATDDLIDAVSRAISLGCCLRQALLERAEVWYTEVRKGATKAHLTSFIQRRSTSPVRHGPRRSCSPSGMQGANGSPMKERTRSLANVREERMMIDEQSAGGGDGDGGAAGLSVTDEAADDVKPVQLFGGRACHVPSGHDGCMCKNGDGQGSTCNADETSGEECRRESVLTKAKHALSQMGLLGRSEGQSVLSWLQQPKEHVLRAVCGLMPRLKTLCPPLASSGIHDDAKRSVAAAKISDRLQAYVPYAVDCRRKFGGVLGSYVLVFSPEEVRQHDSFMSSWLISKDKVYDITPFVWMFGQKHGLETVTMRAGRGVDYHFLGHSETARDLWDMYLIGVVDDKLSRVPVNPAWVQDVDAAGVDDNASTRGKKDGLALSAWMNGFFGAGGAKGQVRLGTPILHIEDNTNKQCDTSDGALCPACVRLRSCFASYTLTAVTPSSQAGLRKWPRWYDVACDTSTTKVVCGVRQWLGGVEAMHRGAPVPHALEAICNVICMRKACKLLQMATT